MALVCLSVLLHSARVCAKFYFLSRIKQNFVYTTYFLRQEVTPRFVAEMRQRSSRQRAARVFPTSLKLDNEPGKIVIGHLFLHGNNENGETAYSA